MGVRSRYINNIIKELQKWESVPNRREPVTIEMVGYIMSKGKYLSKTNPDNIYSALGNWLALKE